LWKKGSTAKVLPHSFRQAEAAAIVKFPPFSIYTFDSQKPKYRLRMVEIPTTTATTTTTKESTRTIFVSAQ
jgi:hypothetical protein